MEGGGLAGGNARFPPLEQATRRAWGNLLTLACLGESRGDSPPASLADNDCQACTEGDKIAQRKRHVQIKGHAAFLLHTLY